MTENEFRTGGTTQASGYAENSKPFARHDTRNQVMEANSSLLIGLRLRIERIAATTTDGLHGVAGHLEDHADRVHGALPECGRANSASTSDAPPAYGAGQLGDLQRAIDNLESALDFAASRVAMAAGRNATLA